MMSDEEITVRKLRAFVSKACKNVGLYLTESCEHDFANAEKPCWCLSVGKVAVDTIDATLPNELIDASGHESSVNSIVSGSSQEELWLEELFRLAAKDKFNRIRVTKRRLAEDGVIENRTNVVFIFGVDVTTCSSWSEVLMKNAIAGTDLVC